MRGASSVEPADRVRVFELAALLLTYPDDELLAAYDGLAAAAAAIEHDEAREGLQAFLAWLGSTELSAIQRHYVATFDLQRKSGLYLTYYLHGDTRKRGVALLTLKQRYRARGLKLADGELPDLLPVVLEFAAMVGPGDGEAPLRQHRRGLELLRAALDSTGSPYLHVLDTITLSLPPLTAADIEAIAALAVDGPPVESVGLDPYGSDLNGPDLNGPDELARIGVAPYPTCPSSEVSA